MTGSVRSLNCLDRKSLIGGHRAFSRRRLPRRSTDLQRQRRGRRRDGERAHRRARRRGRPVLPVEHGQQAAVRHDRLVDPVSRRARRPARHPARWLAYGVILPQPQCYDYNMKTIAITIDEETLARLDRLGRQGRAPRPADLTASQPSLRSPQIHSDGRPSNAAHAAGLAAGLLAGMPAYWRFTRDKKVRPEFAKGSWADLNIKGWRRFERLYVQPYVPFWFMAVALAVLVLDL